jgi:hypothetical protein
VELTGGEQLVVTCRRIELKMWTPVPLRMSSSCEGSSGAAPARPRCIIDRSATIIQEALRNSLVVNMVSDCHEDTQTFVRDLVSS